VHDEYFARDSWIINQIHHLNDECQKVWGSLDSVQRDPIYVSWLRLDEGYVCVNVDGSSQGNPGMFGFGGLVQNNEGH
jgi:hypothetical protein